MDKEPTEEEIVSELRRRKHFRGRVLGDTKEEPRKRSGKSMNEKRREEVFGIGYREKE